MSVYCVRAPELGMVKIGYATSAVKRFAKMQTDSPVRLVLTAFEIGGKILEQGRHDEFADYRVRGEWFRFEGALADHIASLPAYQSEARKYKYGAMPLDAMAEAAGMSRSYVSMLRNGGRGKLPALLHLFKTTGWKHPSLQAYSDETIAELADKISWKSQRKTLSDADAAVAARIHGEQ